VPTPNTHDTGRHAVPHNMRTLRQTVLLPLACAALLLAGCTTMNGGLPTSGPTNDQVKAVPPETGIVLVDLTDEVVRRAAQAARRPLFSESFGAATMPRFAVGPGDVLEIAVWEAPPAALFGTATLDTRGLATGSSRMSTLPEQLVGSNGTINMPFAGSIPAAGRTTQQIEEEIARRLKSKANDPQVMVRVLRNASSTVTVVGEVPNSTRMPLTPRGERLLDALAAAGGTRQPVGKVTVQLTRELVDNGLRTARVAALPLDNVITDPAQNVLLQPGDVVTVLHQPNSLMLLGATTRNEELNFEAQGISLAQALARAGGVNDNRADPQGVFIFRFEDPAVVGVSSPVRTTTDGRIAVVYKVNLRDPATFFTAQSFPMRNKDVLYVANAPGAELQKFLNILSSIVTPVVTVRAFK
jgi:polysaccharide biosynthesis/export protein